MNRSYAGLLLIGAALVVCAGWAGDPHQHSSVRAFLVVFGAFLSGAGIGLAVGYRRGFEKGKRVETRGMFLALRREIFKNLAPRTDAERTLDLPGPGAW